MPSDIAKLIPLVRQMVQSAVTEAIGGARPRSILTGTVEDLDTETLDVAYVRMDQETLGADPMQSDNWGDGGVLPMTRLGDTYIGEPVRVSFDGSAGGSASRTSASLQVVYPFGAEQGDRIVIDGELGSISAGDDTTPGRRVEIDPIGGVRIRSDNDTLVGVIDPQGYTLRSDSTGLVVAELRAGTAGSFRLVDPAGVDDIEMVTASAGTLPNPKFVSAVEANPSSSIVTPASSLFTSTPADDYELYHAAAFIGGTSQAATWTPPAGTTERLDLSHSAGVDTLSVGVADRDPASAVAGTFTSSQTNWHQAVGTHIVIRGGGATSPSFRSSSTVTVDPTIATKIDVSAPKPSGVVAGDALVALVAMGNEGGSVPTGWTTPEGWKFLGANFIVDTNRATAVGAWVKLAGASEPATYDISIAFGAGTKRLHAAIIAVQNPYLISGGAHIRMAGHPIRRLLAFNELQSASATLCDFQNIPGGYDHLELVFDAKSDRATDVLRNIRMRLNNDSGTNYRWYSVRESFTTARTKGQDGVGTQDRCIIGQLDGGATGATTGGTVTIFEYARALRRMIIANTIFVFANGDVAEGEARAIWLNTTDAVNRISVSVDAGTVLFDTGARAYLYGY